MVAKELGYGGAGPGALDLWATCVIGRTWSNTASSSTGVFLGTASAGWAWLSLSLALRQMATS
jgi:hypothetical protein